MNASNAKDFLPLVQALADGKVIQFNSGTNDDPDWNNIGGPAFYGQAEDYRIKPEPREWHGFVKESTRNYGARYRSFTIRMDDATGELPDLAKLSIREILD